MLIQTAQKTSGTTARALFSSPGTYIPKPEVSLTGIVIVSMLLLLELIGLAYLAWYIYQVPTWTAMLDALAIARITNSLDKGVIPAIGSMTDAEVQRLKEIDALIGVVEDTNVEGYSDTSPAIQGKSVELGVGASGLFTRRLADFRVRRSAQRELDCQCEGCRRRRNSAGSVSSISSYR